MTVVWKFPLKLGVNKIRVPCGSELLTVQEQHGEGMLWARCEQHKHVVDRVIEVTGTGVPTPNGTYIGTFQMAGGDYIWHAFDQGEK